MTLDNDDLKAIGDLTDTKMIGFHSKVTEPMIENVMNILREENENNTSRLERKLDNVSDTLAERITNHEKRITKLELSVA